MAEAAAISSFEAKSQGDIDLNELIPVDPLVKFGTLPNGFKYYIRKNDQPKKRAELKLAIKIGSIFEKEHERGIAHMIEHLAFRATKESKDEFETIRELEKHGVRFGAHQNAYTSFDETVYELHIPTDVDGLLDDSLKILRQLALEVRLSDEDVEKERGIVVEEWRASQGGHQRAGEAYFEMVTEGCLYCKRLPIGLMSVIENVPPEVVRKFYNEHYHPSLMAIIVCGDFEDMNQTIETIKTTFGGCTKAGPVPARPAGAAALPDPGPGARPRAGVFRDPELTRASVSLEFVRPARKVRTAGEYRGLLQSEVFHACLQNRLNKLALTPDPPFLNANVCSQEICAALASDVVSAAPQEAKVLGALGTLWREIERVRRFGFAPREVEIAKANLAADTRSCYLERNSTDSDVLASELKDLFLNEVPAPGAEYEYFIGLKLLEGISIQEVNAYVRHLETARNCVVHAKVPAARRGGAGALARRLLALPGRLFSAAGGGGGGGGDFGEEDLLQAIDQAQAEAPGLSEFEHQSAAATTLTPALPSPGTIVKVMPPSPIHGIQELELDNGMKITLMTTDFQDDEVVFVGHADGGLTEEWRQDANDPEKRGYLSAKYAPLVAEELGNFGLPPAELLDVLSGTQVSLDANSSAYGRSVAGDASAKDFEIALQLIHLLFTTEIKYDKERLAVVIEYMKEYLQMQCKSPHSVFSAMTDALNTNNHYYYHHHGPEVVDRVDARRALAHYRALFRDPAAFRFVFAGNVDLAAARPLLEKYLGSIPRPPAHLRPRLYASRADLAPLGVTFPASRVSRTVHMPLISPLAMLCKALPFSAGGGPGGTKGTRLRDNLAAELVATVLERRLLDSLRFELGSIYTVNVGLTYSVSDPIVKDSDPLQGLFLVTLTCKPSDVERIEAKIMGDLEKLSTEGPQEQEVANAIVAHRRERETALRTNNYWANMISRSYKSPRYCGDIEATVKGNWDATDALFESLNAKEIKAYFQQFFGDHGQCRCMSTSVLKSEGIGKKLVKWAVLGGGIFALTAGISAVVTRYFRNKATRKI